MTQPFAPPADTGPDAGGRIGVALGTWALAGAVIGTSVGFTLHATRALEWAAAPFGLGGVLLGIGLGWMVLRMERTRAAGLQALPGQPHTVWPIHGAVQGAPLAAMIPAVMWLSVVVAVSVRSLVPAFVGGLAAMGLGVALVRIASDHRLVAALQALSTGDAPGARRAFQTLAQHPLATRRARAMARENLAAMFLSAGELTAAAHWYAQIEDSAAAAAGLAVAQAGLGQVEAALETIQRGLRCPDARRAQPELDAARLVAVWRSEGADAARQLGERLESPAAGSLFRGLLGRLRGEAYVGTPLLDRLVPEA